jgi:hypothetical protein
MGNPALVSQKARGLHNLEIRRSVYHDQYW